MARPQKFHSVDDYIANYPPGIQEVLQELRSIFRNVAPLAVEKISYNMPTLVLNGNLLYYAAFKKHIGIFPPVKGDEDLARKLMRYRGEKGNLRIPLDEPIPYDLIRKVAMVRIEEHAASTLLARRRKK